MSERMPDFAMPSDDDGAVGGQRAQVDAARRIPSPGSDRSTPARDAVRRRVLATARNPVVAFATGAAVVAAGFLAAPSITEWTERGSLAELQRIVDEYEEAINTGDVEAALALHRPDDGTASMALLDAGVAPTTMPNVICDAPEPRDGIDVAMTRCILSVESLGSNGTPVPLRLERADGGWHLASGLEQPASVDPFLFELVTLGGVPMDGVLDEEQPEYWMLPGAYESEVRSSDLVAITDYGGMVVGDGGGFLNVHAQLADATVADVEAAALAYAEACVAAADPAACGIVAPPSGRDLTATVRQQGWRQEDATYSVPVRIGGTGEVVSPDVEVLVRFDETWTSYELEVTGITELYG